jgi:hypothetical protein
MEVITAHCRDLAVQIVLAVQSGVLVQSSPEHILALKVAHKGYETLSSEERHRYRDFVEPILDSVNLDEGKTQRMRARRLQKDSGGINRQTETANL